MFSQKKGNSALEGGFSINSIGAHTVFEGNIKAEQDIRIDGTLNGNLHCDNRIIIGEQGIVNGDIQCQSALIQGKFNGSVRIQSVLEVTENAELKGEVYTDKLIVHEGAEFNVHCFMGQPAEIHELKKVK